jgi:hypothetical protein
MADNGTAYGYKNVNGKYGFNMLVCKALKKASMSGHRVPFFIPYPNGAIGGGKVSELSTN